MSEPLVFISHFRIKEGALDSLRAFSPIATERLYGEKPRTLLFCSYLDEERNVITFVHAFADADSLDLHFEGSDERSQTALQFIEPLGWEFYGRPSAAVVETMRDTAAASGVPLTLNQEFIAGFMRLAPA